MYVNEETERKIDKLLAKMTLREKLGQLYQSGPSPVGGVEMSPEEAEQLIKEGKMTRRKYESMLDGSMIDNQEDEIRNGDIGSFIGIVGAEKVNYLQKIAVEESRTGIPLIMGLDVIHGHRTIFPIPLALAGTFNEKYYERSAEIAAREASEDGIHWTFAPMVDIGRDSRWGRVAEGAGEDTYLTSLYAAAMVHGFQGDDISKNDRIAACVKHYAAYGTCEGGRDYDTVDMSLPKFYETYLPTYAAGVKAGAATVMTAFNDLNGSPCTTNKFLLHDVLRDQLGFDGFVISDATAISECVNHGVARNAKEAAKQAIEAGTDMDLGSEYYRKYLPEMVKNGEVDISYIDTAVRNVLRIKFAAGLFDNPYTETNVESVKLCREHKEMAREIAGKSVVLIKNENSLLPLKKGMKIAVVGAGADNHKEMLGTWVISGRPEDAVTLVDAFKDNGVDFKYAACCSETEPLDRNALESVIDGADVVIATLSYLSSGEAQSRCDLTITENQIQMIEEIKKAGKPLVTVLFNGRPLAVGNAVSISDSFVEAWHLGTEAGNALYDILFGKVNPSGRLTVTFPNHPAENPIYYNHTNTGRPRGESRFTSKYMDVPLEPLFPFGYGLSYTEYEYSDFRLSAYENGLEATVTVKNIGNCAGEETVQLYVHRRNAVRVRPVKELKGFAKINLLPGESSDVKISVDRSMLGYYDFNMNYITDESEFDVWMSHDSSGGLSGVIRV